MRLVNFYRFLSDQQESHPSTLSIFAVADIKYPQNSCPTILELPIEESPLAKY